MNKVSNQKVLKELVKEQLTCHKSRNFVMIVAILLTTVLISFTFTAGFSFLTTMQESVQAAPGPGADGALIGTKDQLESVEKKDQVEWADYVQRCSTTSLHNDSFAGIQTELLAPDENFYAHNFISLIKGSFPKKNTQLLISDTFAEKTGLKELGEELILQVVVLQGGKEKEIEVPMEICGIYKNPLLSLSNTYEEIYSSPEFIDTYNPEMPKNQNYIYIKLNNLNPFLLKSDVYDKLVELKETVKAESVQTKNYSTFLYSLIIIFPMLICVFMIILSGYFLIYNVFSISVASDIRWFGMMKTIGASKTQLKYIYMRQIRILAVIGITIGSIVGYVAGLFLAPRIIRMTDFYTYYKDPNMIPVFLFAILFSWFTVWFSSSKTIRTAASYSPIEAARYIPHHRKKAFTILSFSLSGIIFLLIGNVTFGYQVNHMVERYNQDEVRIQHIAALWSLNESYKPISEGLSAEIEKLPFVKQVDVIYMAKTMPDLMEGLSQKMYEGFLAEVKLDGKLKEEIDEMVQTGLLNGDSGMIDLTTNGNIKLKICGMPAVRLEKESNYIKILDGDLNLKEFESGNFILYQDVDYLDITEKKIDPSKKIHAGDAMKLSFYDDLTGTYQVKEVTVMAVIGKNNRFGTGNIGYSNIVMSDQLFKSLYPDYNERVASIQVVSDENFTSDDMKAIMNLAKKEHNVQVQIDAKYEDRVSYTRKKQSITILGFFLTLVIGIIGISNLVNTLVTDTLSRRNEISTLQSIGMTKKQLWWLLFKNGMLLCSISAVIILLAGRYITMAVAASTMFTGFNDMIFVICFIILLCFMGALSAILASIMTVQLNKKSVVERLREIQ
ncbi:FtsX-like permease family protein [Clostridium sp. E02]|uniref:ABC transporter permease n=1 Tax=Clostridium sp. E02 TaxID=2487134 RepID=UPI000F5344C3|nr:FtsX-like permease family protein [Clostridium sp. E02]